MSRRRRNAAIAPFALALVSCRGAALAREPSPPAATAPFLSSNACPAPRHLLFRGDLTRADWLAAWDPSARILSGEGNASIVDDPRLGKALRVRYPAGSSSSSYAREGHPVGGLEFRAALPGSGHESIYFSYWLKFDDRFSWVRGGKLPGLCGGSCPSGGKLVTGEGGWSLRYMWRANGDGEAYAYVLPPHEYGTELGKGSWHFTTGTWHRLSEELILNKSGKPDGVIRIWYDEDPSRPPTFEATDLTYRSDATPVTAVFFSTFFGGHDASWASPIDTFVDFADFVVCE